MSIFDELKKENYRIGDWQAIRYDRNNPIFPDGFLGNLYFALAGGRRSVYRRENLQAMFCGVKDLSFDAITTYLAMQPMVIMGKWEGDVFRTGGMVWTVSVMGGKERSAFGAYGFIRWTWGTEDQEIMTWLGISHLFNEMNLLYIHAQRYEDNHLSANYLKRFGFRDLATVPKMIARGDGLVGGVISTLSREDFEIRLTQWMLQT